MNPVIAIPQMGNDLFRKYMKSKYVRSLRRAGAQVRWIELTDLDKAIAEVRACDGLLLPGGADVNPRLYGHAPSEKCGKPNTLRDTGEMELLTAFLPTGKPILGICRGVQLMNVFFGGTLHQDIKDTQKCNHSDFRGKNRGNHAVTLTPGTKLAEIFGAETLIVNSLHHQAADIPGKDLSVSAISEDGFIEGLEHQTHPFCLGVQWHPEHMSHASEAQRKLFRAFVDACGKT